MKKGNKPVKKTLLAMALVLFVLSGCNKTDGCQQPFSQEEIPELIKGYNTCETIYKNYTYLICDGMLESYPYWKHEGDTIKVCGYLYERWEGDRSLLPLYDYADNLVEHECCIHVRLDADGIAMLPNHIDNTKKCFVTGQLAFNILYTNGGPYYVVPCLSNVKGIYFE